MESPKAPLITRPILLFMGTMILANVAFFMQRPLMALYVQSLGADVGQVGLFFTLSAIVPLAFQILGGWLSDVIGRLQAIALGSLSGVVSYLIFVIAPSWEWLLPATAFMWIAVSFVGPSFDAYIAEQSTEETRGRVYGITQAMFMVVGVIGPPLGGYISQGLSFRAMYLVGGVMYATAAIVRVLMAVQAGRRETQPRQRPSLGGLKTSLLEMAGLVLAGGVVTWIFLSDGVRDVTFGLGGQLMPLYMQNLMGITNVEIGWLSAIAAGITMVLVSAAGWLSDKKGERVGITLGFLFIALAMVVFLGSRAFTGFALTWALYGVGDALISPAYQSLISKTIPQRLRGTAFGFFSTSIGLVALPAPYIGGWLWEHVSPQMPFIVPLVAILLTLPIVWFKFKPPAAPQTETAEATAD